MKIEQQIAAAVSAALAELYGQQVPADSIQLQKTKREFEGHLTLVVFPYLKMSRKKPEDTACEIGEYLVKNSDAVSAYGVVKGFLNLTVASAKWLELLADIHADEQYGLTAADEKSPLVMVEYSSPNTNKPLHLGHIRNNSLGYSFSEILKANGEDAYIMGEVTESDEGVVLC